MIYLFKTKNNSILKKVNILQLDFQHKNLIAGLVLSQSKDMLTSHKLMVLDINLKTPMTCINVNHHLTLLENLNLFKPGVAKFYKFELKKSALCQSFRTYIKKNLFLYNSCYLNELFLYEQDLNCFFEKQSYNLWHKINILKSLYANKNFSIFTFNKLYKFLNKNPIKNLYKITSGIYTSVKLAKYFLRYSIYSLKKLNKYLKIKNINKFSFPLNIKKTCEFKYKKKINKLFFKKSFLILLQNDFISSSGKFEFKSLSQKLKFYLIFFYKFKNFSYDLFKFLEKKYLINPLFFFSKKAFFFKLDLKKIFLIFHTKFLRCHFSISKIFLNLNMLRSLVFYRFKKFIKTYRATAFKTKNSIYGGSLFLDHLVDKSVINYFKISSKFYKSELRFGRSLHNSENFLFKLICKFSYNCFFNLFYLHKKFKFFFNYWKKKPLLLNFIRNKQIIFYNLKKNLIFNQFNWILSKKIYTNFKYFNKLYELKYLNNYLNISEKFKVLFFFDKISRKYFYDKNIFINKNLFLKKYNNNFNNNNSFFSCKKNLKRVNKIYNRVKKVTDFEFTSNTKTKFNFKLGTSRETIIYNHMVWMQFIVYRLIDLKTEFNDFYRNSERFFKKKYVNNLFFPPKPKTKKKQKLWKKRRLKSLPVVLAAFYEKYKEIGKLVKQKFRAERRFLIKKRKLLKENASIR